LILAGLALFFVVFPPIVAYQSGRASALALPVGLIAVSIEWAITAEDDHGLPRLGLTFAVIGLAATFVALRAGRRRRVRPR
jgi:hypothetical protein